MTHGDPIIDGDGIELSSKVSASSNDLLYLLTDVMQDVRVPGTNWVKELAIANTGFPN